MLINKIRLYLYAQLYPIKSFDLVKKDIIKETFQENKCNKEKQDNIRDAFLKELECYYHVRNLDELELTIHYFFPYLFHHEAGRKDNIYLYYLDTLDKLSECFITIRDGNITYKHWSNKNDTSLFGIRDNQTKIQIFHDLIRFIPIDILIVNIVYKNYENNKELYQNIFPLDGIYNLVNIAEAQLDIVLSKGVAENHMHMGAGLNFEMIWRNLMNNAFLEKVPVYYHNLEKLKFETQEKNSVFYASYLRSVLSYFILCGKKGWSFPQILKENLYEIKQKTIFSHTYCEFSYFHEYCNEFLHICNLEYDENDIVFCIFKEEAFLKTTGENLFLIKALAYCKENQKDDFFMECFFDYLRIKNHFYSKIVEYDKIKGLTYFQEYYKAMSSLSNHKDILTFFRSNFQNVYLKKLETRISIPNNYTRFKKQLQRILEAYQQVIKEDYIQKGSYDFPRFGLVYHFLKRPDEERKKCWRNYRGNDSNTNSYLYFKVQQNQYLEQLNNILKLRKENPYISRFLLGIDAASNENNTPVSVFSPIFQKARDSNDDLLYIIDDDGIKINQKSLRFTFHAGEDFRHILSGLRRIDEVIEKCKFHAGDRIGHGIALACDIEKWTEANPMVLIPTIEHIENLLWLWGLFSTVTNNNSDTFLYLEKEILKYATKIYGDTTGITISMLYNAYQKGFEIFEVNEKYEFEEICNNQNEKENQEKRIFCIKAKYEETKIWNEEKLSYCKHCECYLNRMKEPLFLEINEIQKIIMKKAQVVVRKKLAQMGIVIEINPTSNAAIGEMNTIFNHPAFELNGREDTEENDLLISVNSDNPSVFNTNVSNELSLMYYHFLNKNKNKLYTLKWIDTIREIGMTSSFIDDEMEKKEYYHFLLKAIDSLKK